MNKSTVTFRYKTKPILLEVESGYSTLGSFFIYALHGSSYIELFMERNKNIHQDDFVHIFLLPFDTEKLSKTKLYIFGKYGPAPRHNQVFVEYNFLQDDKELEVDKKKSNLIEATLGASSQRFFNVFEFEFKK